MAEEVAYKPEIPYYKGAQTGYSEPKVIFPKTYIAPTNRSTGATYTIYTVPAGKIFILLNAWVGYIADNASGGGDVEITTTDPNMPAILGATCKDSPAAAETFNGNVTMSYPSGIVFPAGTVFQGWNASSMNTKAGLVGYLLHEKALNLFTSS